MPWFPDLFSASVLERIRREAADTRAAAPVPYFDGLRSGETDALVGSFAGEPELHHPIRGRVRGRRAFERFVTETNAWLTEHNAAFSPVERIITPRRAVEEIVMTLDVNQGRVEMPVAVAAERDDDGRIIELRIYWSMWPLTGRHAHRPPLLEPDPNLTEPDIVGEYQRALAAGDAEAIVATFEPDAYVREPAGSVYVHRGHEKLRELFRRFFSSGGIQLEHCAVTDDSHACALEYNIVRWGRTELEPEAGLAVYVRGATGKKLASARIYDDADPPVSCEP